MLVYAVIELASDASDDFLSPRIGPAESAAGKPAEMLVGAHDDDGFTHPGGLDGRAHTGGCAAVDDDVVGRIFDGGLGHAPDEHEEN